MSQPIWATTKFNIEHKKMLSPTITATTYSLRIATSSGRTLTAAQILNPTTTAAPLQRINGHQQTTRASRKTPPIRNISPLSNRIAISQVVLIHQLLSFSSSQLTNSNSIKINSREINRRAMAKGNLVGDSEAIIQVAQTLTVPMLPLNLEIASRSTLQWAKDSVINRWPIKEQVTTVILVDHLTVGLASNPWGEEPIMVVKWWEVACGEDGEVETTTIVRTLWAQEIITGTCKTREEGDGISSRWAETEGLIADHKAKARASSQTNSWLCHLYSNKMESVINSLWSEAIKEATIISNQIVQVTKWEVRPQAATQSVTVNTSRCVSARCTCKVGQTVQSSSASSTNFSANFALSAEALSQQVLATINPIVVAGAPTMETITFSNNLSNSNSSSIETKMGQQVACRRNESDRITWTVNSMQSFKEKTLVARVLRHKQTEARKEVED